jgi:hypothetical protein
VLDRAMDIVWLMREELQSRPEFLNLGEGFLRRTVERGRMGPVEMELTCRV